MWTQLQVSAASDNMIKIYDEERVKFLTCPEAFYPTCFFGGYPFKMTITR